MKNLEKIFKGLANRRRLAIIKLLAKNKQLSVTDIAKQIKLSFKATSKHLSVLRQLDIVDRNQVGLTAYYRFSHTLPHPVNMLVSTISNSRE
ncbi:MAG: hypothetical protein A3G49_03255 [Candidatus Sungbacteria bacterium RIFCSPLOWO2_12_FULL_41_11]|uniref:HTH arsR-type domain-containing protein n=1 Tax=Candidatus Sungbacteria bacterium RIFCSPLOWO2_12_FULL_41_11 TaxID=1802286 RepID=A0A1G2LSY7_9BACT|nr:MAG: hypothetical protein UV01_C0015G0009 [Parcubacteria group bacterium GW2011_GWA2_42_14]OHA00156.1 MAG: hypothetical protein A3D41_03665 [Candidatus Sungbacteria bacterium RIFCSPHIGHO2_02_FULL_41_12b]OHA14727.1 MAG: hypothetical protein A3G49_03255 [Candidatus Sungbacteria bacterium RIFCSPLOWO2_12_FULL_41_11]